LAVPSQGSLFFPRICLAERHFWPPSLDFRAPFLLLSRCSAIFSSALLFLFRVCFPSGPSEGLAWAVCPMSSAREVTAFLFPPFSRGSFFHFRHSLFFPKTPPPSSFCRPARFSYHQSRPSGLLFFSWPGARFCKAVPFLSIINKSAVLFPFLPSAS